MTDVTKTSLKLFGAVVLAVVLLAGLGWVVDQVRHPFGLRRNALPAAKAEAKVNGQQAKINADGAAINDSRANNIAKIHKTAQEARHAVQQTTDHDARLREYLSGLERLRRDGESPIAVDPADGRGHDPLR